MNNLGFRVSENFKGNKLVFRLNDTCWTKPVLFTNAKPAITCSGKNKNSKNRGFKEKTHLSAIPCSSFLLNIKYIVEMLFNLLFHQKKHKKQINILNKCYFFNFYKFYNFTCDLACATSSRIYGSFCYFPHLKMLTLTFTRNNKIKLIWTIIIIINLSFSLLIKQCVFSDLKKC